MNAPRIKTHTQYERELQTAKAGREEARAALAKEKRERAAEVVALREELASLTAAMATLTAAAGRATHALDADKALRIESGKVSRAMKAAKRAEAAVRVDLDLSRNIARQLESEIRRGFEDADEVIRKARARAAEVTPVQSSGVEHGTTTAYVNDGCRCAACRAAHSRACTAAKRRRLAATIPDDRHGVYSTYSNHGCRCPKCTAAATAYVRAARERRLARL